MGMLLRSTDKSSIMTDYTAQTPVANAEVDARGLSCPLPLLKAKLALNALPSGAVLHVLATDAGSQRDFRAFVRLAGHALLHEYERDGIYQYWLCKS